MTVKISEQRTKEGYEITFFTDNKPLFRKARVLLDELSSEERTRNSEQAIDWSENSQNDTHESKYIRN